MSGIESGADHVIDRAFWEDELQMCLDPWLPKLKSQDHIREWVGKLKKQPIRVLCSHLGVKGGASVEAQRTALANCDGALIPYFLVDRFAYRRLRFAVADYAGTVLPAEVIEASRLNEREFDVTALLFELYQRDPAHLRAVFHLEKIHITGFARMKLKNRARKPRKSLKDYLMGELVEELLGEFDAATKDGRSSKFRSIMSYREHHLVFVRREERRAMLLRSQHAVHGFSPEWIVLDFRKNGKEVDIASVSMSVPVEIANRIASKYYGCKCEYVNEVQVTPKALLLAFLDALKNDTCTFLRLVEISAKNSPLDGAPGLRISSEDEAPIAESVRHFEKAVGDITEDLDLIRSIKVLYNGKRVKVLFEPYLDGHELYVVRYVDRTLNADERSAFESKLRDNPYGIRALSTEKRHKK